MTPAAAAVLIVDDNESSRFAKASLLRRAGYRVVEAGAGLDALKMLRQQPIDLVLLDINLPDISGIEVCARIRRDPALPGVQVLQISSTAITDRDKILGLEGGADAYLTEPTQPDVLLATLRALLRVRQAEHERALALEREQEARRVAEEANRIKDQFLATLSHELRTPLNAALGWIALMKTGGLDAARQTRALEALERSARQQWRLVNELLDAASIQQRKMHLEIATVDLDAIGAAVLELIRPEAARKQVELAATMRPVRTTGDPARLQQVITNLLNNGVQFTRPGGRVALTIDQDADGAVIQVEDSGIGIDPRFLPHVFEEFRQADSSGAGEGGLGLGLAISRHIVELHGGRISAASPGVGQGATFTVRIPGPSQTDAPPAASG